MIMTLEDIRKFIETEDFGFASANGTFGAICDNEQREMILSNFEQWNTPEAVEGEELAELFSHFPEFKEETANGCLIYSCDVYEEANRIDTYYIAYYE